MDVVLVEDVFRPRQTTKMEHFYVAVNYFRKKLHHRSLIRS